MRPIRFMLLTFTPVQSNITRIIHSVKKQAMSTNQMLGNFLILFLFTSFLAGCNSALIETKIATVQFKPPTALILPTSTFIPLVTPLRPSSTPDLSDYAFPDTIDTAKPYMFYLHGKIIEDQGIPAISSDYGEYEYGAILEILRELGFAVISEQRLKNTDSMEFAKRVSEQVKTLLDAGVPAKNITVVGASKGAGIAIFISDFLENRDINYVILAICNPEIVEEFRQNDVSLYGNVLSIYDSSDKLAGTCQELFSFSENKGLSRHDEIILNVGNGHGLLYKPLDDWIIPTVQWARSAEPGK